MKRIGSSGGRRRRRQGDRRHGYYHRGYHSYYEQKWRLADWDADGNVDILYVFNDNELYEWHIGSKEIHNVFLMDWRQLLSNHSFQTHAMMRWPYLHIDSFEVVDWDGNKKLDLLFCKSSGSTLSRRRHPYRTEVIFLNDSLLPLDALNLELEYTDYLESWSGLIRHMNASLLLSVSDSAKGCEMWPVDFDGDGDVDLFLGQRYFERTAAGDLVERNENPMVMFNGNIIKESGAHRTFHSKILQIADVDGDGQLEVITEGDSVAALTRCKGLRRRHTTTYSQLQYFRRTVDGRFVESLENPLAGIRLERDCRNNNEFLRLTDWDSDGLMDLVKVQFQWSLDFKVEFLPVQWSFDFEVVAYYQHVVKLDMSYNSHAIAFEHIKMDLGQFRVIDWDGDGWDDLLVRLDGRLHLYQVKAQNVHELFQPFERVSMYSPSVDFMFSLADWDADGDLDLIIATNSDFKVHFFEMDSGSLKPEKAQHPFRDIRLDRHFSPQVLTVDWDNDGDFDLVLGSGRYFEQLPDGTLHEWSLQQSPFAFLCSNMSWNRRCNFDLRFLDCDGDGDFDFILRTGQKFQACEHDSVSGTVRCDENFLCLGANVGSLSLSSFPGQFQQFGDWDLGNSSDGRLKLFAQHSSRPRPIQWTAGFCEPSMDPCHGKGICRPGQLNCQCFPGHELGDCSRCEPNYYSFPDPTQFRDCQPCPGQGSAVCHGRGDCFDDASARDLAQHYTAALEARGNGSCRCHEACFGDLR